MAAEGAALIRRGRRSHPSGAEPVSADEELRPVIPVIDSAARGHDRAHLCRTSKAEVHDGPASAAAPTPQRLCARCASPGASPTAVRAAARCASCNSRVSRAPAGLAPIYADVVGRGAGVFSPPSLRAALPAGLPPSAWRCDPVFGFGKLLEHNLTLSAPPG